MECNNNGSSSGEDASGSAFLDQSVSVAQDGEEVIEVPTETVSEIMQE